MKNYPILQWHNFTPYKNYYHYLEELNNEVFSLFQYSEYWKTDYRLNDKINQNVDELDVTQLSFHNYLQLNQQQKVKCGDITKTFAPGTLIISQARAEGTIDKHPTTEKDPTSTNPILTNWNNYFIQPVGWRAFYLPFFTQIEENSRYYPAYAFQFDQYAEEHYGQSIYFAFDTYYTRYFINELRSKRTFTNGENFVVAISARGTDKQGSFTDLIVDHQGKIWSAIKTNPLMSFTFLCDSDDDQDYGEEVIIDSAWQVSTFARSNIASYTIIANNNIDKKWPNHNNDKIVVDVL